MKLKFSVSWCLRYILAFPIRLLLFSDFFFTLIFEFSYDDSKLVSANWTILYQATEKSLTITDSGGIQVCFFFLSFPFTATEVNS